MLGHALCIRAIHGGKATHDQSDAHKIATLLRGGMLPQAFVYPAEMRAPRDLLRHCMGLMRHRSALLSHVQHTTSQDHLPEIAQSIAGKANRVVEDDITNIMQRQAQRLGRAVPPSPVGVHPLPN